MTEFKPGEFDFRKAWTEWAKPKFDALPADIRETYELIAMTYGELKQNKQLNIDWPEDEELRTRFYKIAAEYLAKAIPIIYAYGHWGSGWAIPNDGGAYWKFEKLGKKMLIDKGLAGAWTEHECDTKQFVVLSPLEIAVDEGLKDSGLHRRDITNVNFKPHPFVIGPQHFPKDGGIFIRPEQAPCAMRGCNLSYAEHKSDRVLVVSGLELGEDDKPLPEQEVALRFLVPVLEKYEIDGFVFVKEEA